MRVGRCQAGLPAVVLAGAKHEVGPAAKGDGFLMADKPKDAPPDTRTTEQKAKAAAMAGANAAGNYAGGFALSVAMPSVPGLGLVETTDKMVCQLPPAEMQARNHAKLLAAGVKDAVREQQGLR